MTLAWVETSSSLGLTAPAVRVEVHLSPGLPGIAIVGLSEGGMRDCRERVRSALISSGFEFPQQRITINLAPADLPKEGGRFDLPIALGILAASRQLPADRLEGLSCLGELALSGALRPVQAVLSASLAAGRRGHALIVPAGNAGEAVLARDTRVLGADCLADVVQHLRGTRYLPETAPGAGITPDHAGGHTELAMVRGQAQARRALEIAAAGGHSLLLCGPPGAGKTLMATCLPGLLPPLSADEQLEVAELHSLAGSTRALSSHPPCRAPHHSATRAALIGGGGIPRPGDISLAHRGVLFLDELPEFDRSALEALREPLETGQVLLSRARHQLRYPAGFQLVAAMNPCPCGQWRPEQQGCRCTPEQISRYRGRVSGPLLDRLDLRVRVEPVPLDSLQGAAGETSACVRERVLRARRHQTTLNARLAGDRLAETLDEPSRRFLRQAGERMALSARAYHRVLRVARTIADLHESGAAQRTAIAPADLAEALAYRGDGW